MSNKFNETLASAIASALEATDMDVRTVVDELASETYFKRIAANLAK